MAWPSGDVEFGGGDAGGVCGRCRSGGRGSGRWRSAGCASSRWRARRRRGGARSPRRGRAGRGGACRRGAARAGRHSRCGCTAGGVRCWATCEAEAGEACRASGRRPSALVRSLMPIAGAGDQAVFVELVEAVADGLGRPCRAGRRGRSATGSSEAGAVEQGEDRVVGVVEAREAFGGWLVLERLDLVDAVDERELAQAGRRRAGRLRRRSASCGARPTTRRTGLSRGSGRGCDRARRAVPAWRGRRSVARRTARRRAGAVGRRRAVGAVGARRVAAGAACRGRSRRPAFGRCRGSSGCERVRRAASSRAAGRRRQCGRSSVEASVSGYGPTASCRRCEVRVGPGVGDRGGEGEGLADEAGGAGAAGDPGGQAVVDGQVEDLLGGDAHAGARVGVVADHRRVDGHRDPDGVFGVLVVAEPEQEAALEQVDDALADLLLGARSRSRAGRSTAGRR